MVEAFDLAALEKAVEEQLMHALMLGALDSAYEREQGHAVAPVAFAVPNLPGGLGAVPGFATHPYAKAIEWFRGKTPVDRATFDELHRTSKLRAFTVAGMSSQQMLETAQDEIAKQIEKGAELRDFRKAVADRLESAGWTPANGSHVENIFRTNVMNAYNSGRHAEMTQPAVLAVWKYWQVLGVKDARTRKSHARVQGWVFRADDAGWHKCSCPFGYMCRCRIRAMTQAQVERLCLTVHSWSEVDDLPDPGFVSGTDAYLAPHGGPKLRPVSQAPARTTPRPPVPARPRPAPPEHRPPPPPPPAPAPVPVRPPPPAPTPPPYVPPAPRPAPPPTPVPQPPPPPPVGRPLTPEQFKKAGIYVGDTEDIKRAEEVLGQRVTPQLVKDLLGIHSEINEADYEIRCSFSNAGWGGEKKTAANLGLTRRSDGATVEINREYFRKDGKLVVHHALFLQDDKIKAAGLGKRVLQNQVAQYVKLGADRLETEAAWDGQYVWPRMGYTLRDPNELDRFKAEFKAWLTQHDFSDRAAERIASAPTSIQELALSEGKRRDGKVEKVGKDFLLWRGHKSGRGLIRLEAPLAPGSPMRQYLGV